MTQITYTDYDHGITALDAGYQRSGMVAIHLLIEHGRAAIIDTGTNHSVDHVMRMIAFKHVRPDDVDYVILTHVHLDHAGGAGELMRHLPRARAVVHPRGARHMVDPAKLLAGATAVYGAGETARNFGQIVPIPADRIIEAPDLFTLRLGGRNLLFLDTPGHARHHFCVFDERSNAIFTGDTFGVSYREFDTEAGEFIFPTTTPVQFNPAALHASIDRLMVVAPRHMFLTHFGRVGNPERLAQDLHERIDMLVEIARNLRDTGARRHESIKRAIEQVLIEQLATHNCRLGRERILELMKFDIELNAQGLGVWVDSGTVA
ncbi:MAG: MBL fold metallo-hydrolase [Acidiferrobacterales bacterium]